ncbi:MAG: TonB-dependent receptor [Bacteroidales bacterium]|nr:TonB-dependent receptor [Bacteroidales bacterium]
MKKTFCLLLTVAAVSAYAEQQDTLRTVSLDEVVATGTRSQTDSRLLPMTVSVVNEAKLTQRNEVNILPTLNEQVPGLFVTQRGVMGYGVSTGGSGGIKVRGIGGSPNTDILVLIDGLPQYAGLYGHPVADNYQTMMAERVEVIRGPASIYYGSNAMGGVVNIVTRQPKTDAVMSNLHLQYGSYATLDAGATNQVRRGKFSSAVGFNYTRTDGHRDNMEFDEKNGFVRLGYDVSDNWRLSATGNVAHFNSSNPGPVSKPLEDNDMHILRGMAALSLENSFEATSGALRVFYNGGKHEIYDGFAQGVTPPASTYFHKDIMAGVSAYQSVAFFEGNNTTIGFDYQHFGGHAWNEALADGKETDIIDKTQNEIAGYADFRQNIAQRLTFDAGVRIDWHSESGTAYAPQAGLSLVLPSDAQLKVLASRGFRNPTLRELYMYKPANKELECVSLWNYEISYRQYLIEHRLKLGANVFYLDAKDNIETRVTDGRPLNVNTGEMKNTGVELEIGYDFGQGLRVDANYSYLNMDTPVLAAPEHKLNASVRYHHESFRIGTSLQCITGLYTELASASAPATKEDFVLWNADAAVRICKGLWANLKADNLIGQEYEINAGFTMPKTTIMGGLNWSF